MTFTRKQLCLMANLKRAGVNKETAVRTLLCLDDHQIDVFNNWAKALNRVPISTEIDQKVAEIVIEDRKKLLKSQRIIQSKDMETE